MSYLRIHSKNTQVSITDMFTLGVSTSRGTEKIGQFGSGALMAVLLWLREYGCAPVFFVNGQKVRFTFKPEAKSDGGQFNRVYQSDTKKVPLTVAMEHGELDWKEPGMALREWISNAIDQGEDITSSECIDEVSKITPTESGVTCYVQMNGDVRKYWGKISEYFLHYSGQHTKKMIPKAEISPCRVYRRGVYIRTLDQESIFDYNLDFDIAESRNGSSDSMEADIFNHLGYDIDEDNSIRIMSYVMKNEKSLETKWESWRGRGRNTWKSALDGLEDKVIPNNTLPDVGSGVRIPSKWYDFIVEHRRELDGLASTCELTREGMKILPPSEELIKDCDNAWAFFELIGMTNGKTKPEVNMFESVNGTTPKALGVYSPNVGTISIWKDCHKSLGTIVHEMAHHITGAKDHTSQFQEFGFDSIARFIEAS